MFRDVIRVSGADNDNKLPLDDGVMHGLGGELLGKPSVPLQDAVAHDGDDQSLLQLASRRSSHGGGGHSSQDGGHHRGRARHPVDPEDAYWSRVNEARHEHKFITEYPPVRPGMDKPKPPDPPGPFPLPKQGHFMSVNDMISASKDLMRIAHPGTKQSDFVISDLDENSFKQRYAQEAMKVGKDFGLSKDEVEDLVKKIYAFEDGGWGTYDTLTNTPEQLADPNQIKTRRSFHGSGTALGYNQLMLADTRDNVEHKSGELAARLEELASEQPARSAELLDKAAMVRGLQETLEHGPPMVRKGKHTVAQWPKNLDPAIQSLNLDGDIGPVLQAHELRNLLQFFKDHNLMDSLKTKAANDVASADKFDHLPKDKKQAAVDELMKRVMMPGDPPFKDDQVQQFQTAKDSIAAKMLALPPGLSDGLRRDKLTDGEQTIMNAQVLQIRRFGGALGPLSADARSLLDKATLVYDGGITAGGLKAAALELANLAGNGAIGDMVNPDNADLPTTNFFSRAGYKANPSTQRRSADELLMYIDRVMHGPHADPNKPGNKAFTEAFKNVK